MPEFVTHTDNPAELVIRLSHPKIRNHKQCVRPGMAGWRTDGTPVPCTCVQRLLREEWAKNFKFKPMKSFRFTPESVIAEA